MTVFDDNSIFKKELVGSFALLRLTLSNDSLMNGQEGTGRPTWLRRQLGSDRKVALLSVLNIARALYIFIETLSKPGRRRDIITRMVNLSIRD